MACVIRNQCTHPASVPFTCHSRPYPGQAHVAEPQLHAAQEDRGGRGERQGLGSGRRRLRLGLGLGLGLDLALRLARRALLLGLGRRRRRALLRLVRPGLLPLPLSGGRGCGRRAVGGRVDRRWLGRRGEGELALLLFKKGIAWVSMESDDTYTHKRTHRTLSAGVSVRRISAVICFQVLMEIVNPSSSISLYVWRINRFDVSPFYL